MVFSNCRHPVASPGVTAKLNGALTSGGDLCNFTFSPDSRRVAYCADQDTDEVTELYSVELCIAQARRRS